MSDSKPHSELRTAVLEGLLHERPSFSAGLQALDSLIEQLEAYREFYDAHWEVEMGVADFDLHAESVSRLEAAHQRVRSLASNPASRSDDA